MIRVLRLIEYTYETNERAEEDMDRWALPANCTKKVDGMTIRSSVIVDLDHKGEIKVEPLPPLKTYYNRHLNASLVDIYKQRPVLSSQHGQLILDVLSEVDFLYSRGLLLERKLGRLEAIINNRGRR